MLPARRLLPLARPFARSLSSTPSRPDQPPTTPPAADTTTTDSAAQPTSPPASREASKPRSSVPAGIPLKGLNYLKSKSDPIALDDAAYPAWLWTLLTPAGGPRATKKEVDPRLFSKSANIRRKARKRARAEGTLEEEDLGVPLAEQTLDLRVDGEAHAARQGLTKALRAKRRGEIKEKNFLKAMG